MHFKIQAFLFSKYAIELKKLVNFKYFSTQIQRNFDSNRAIKAPEHYLSLLRDKFKHEDFKPFQWSVIQSIIDNKQDNYICLPTGYGKSLCYQYPAVYSNGLSIVISPLISLMQNQVKYLEGIDVPSCFISSIQENKSEIIKNLLKGNYRLLYITPESALNSTGLKLLENLYKEVKITLVAVDEVQCVLHWGQDFRPFYKQLCKIRSIMPQIPIIALTASTTENEKNIIIENLNLRNVQHIHDGLNRKNLYFIVRKMTKEPFGDIVNVLKNDASKYNIADGSAIVYCLTKKSCIKVAKLLNSMSIHCQVYHSDLNIVERSEVLDNFISDKIKVIVATNAFGLGVHKSDVRFVIHYGTSLNIENYYQEAGRAGRDGEKSLCVLLYSLSDFSTHRYLGKNKKSEDKEIHNDTSLTMKKYIMNSSCRRQFILSHFDKSYEKESEYEPECCDVCTNNLNNIKLSELECSSDVEIFLRTIESLKPKTYGIKSIVSFIFGSKKKDLIELSLDNKYFGIGASKSKDWWTQLALFLEIEKYIKVDGTLDGFILYSKVSLDDRGMSWLRDRNNGITTPVTLKLSEHLIS